MEQAPEKVDKRIDRILEAVDELVFNEQWQVDEYDPKSRRIIADNRFRILYRKTKNGILIVRVYPVKKNPKGITGK